MLWCKNRLFRWNPHNSTKVVMDNTEGSLYKLNRGERKVFARRTLNAFFGRGADTFEVSNTKCSPWRWCFMLWERKPLAWRKSTPFNGQSFSQPSSESDQFKNSALLFSLYKPRRDYTSIIPIKIGMKI